MPSPPLASRLPLPPRIAVGFAAALVSLVVAAGASYAAIRARTSTSRLVRHTAEARLAIEEVESALLVSRVALEAYLSDGDPRHLELHARATSKLEPAVRSLERIGRAHPENEATIAGVARDVGVVREADARVVALLRAGDRAGARAAEAGGGAGEATARAKAALEALEDAELRLHEGRETAWNRSVAVSNGVFVTAVVVLLALVLLAARLVHDEIRQREREAAAREQALLVQRRIIGVVSHDLRNPLAGILVSAWTVLRGGPPERAASAAARIVKAGTRMEGLIRDLLDWSRLQDGVALPISRRPADLADVCRRMADEVRETRGREIILERDGDTRGVFDPERMEQVVANLLSNAARHGSADAPIRISAVGLPDALVVEVENAGPEIPAAARAGIFEPFRRGPGGDGAGVGLGLFIVRAVAEAHGGGVTLTSAGGSTRFVVRLPRGGEPAEARAG